MLIYSTDELLLFKNKNFTKIPFVSILYQCYKLDVTFLNLVSDKETTDDRITRLNAVIDHLIRRKHVYKGIK